MAATHTAAPPLPEPVHVAIDVAQQRDVVQRDLAAARAALGGPTACRSDDDDAASSDASGSTAVRLAGSGGTPQGWKRPPQEMLTVHIAGLTAALKKANSLLMDCQSTLIREREQNERQRQVAFAPYSRRTRIECTLCSHWTRTVLLSSH